MIVKRPGLVVDTQFASGCAQGAINYAGVPLFIIGDAVAGASEAITGISWTLQSSPTKPSNGSSVGTAKAGSFVSLSGNLYAFGGRDNADTTISVFKSTNNGTSWTNIATPWTTTVTPENQTGVAYNNKLWAFGIVATQNVHTSSDGITWTLLGATLPSHVAKEFTVHGGYIYCAISNNSVNYVIYRTVDGLTWTNVGTVSGTTNFRSSSFVSSGDNLYLIGGQDTVPVRQSTVFRSVDNGFTWIQLTSTANFGTFSQGASWYANGKLWIAGGSGTSGSAAVWYSFDGITWTQATASAWPSRNLPANAVHNGTLYIGPGVSGSTIVSSTYSALVSAPGALTPPPPVPCEPFQATLIPADTSHPVRVFLKNNNIAYLYDGTTITHINDADYPPNTVWGVVYLDGTVYVMNSLGQIFGSDLANYTSWTATNVIVANAFADSAVALARQLNYIVAFKATSIEFFYDAGNPTGSPLSKVINATLAMGCAVAGSITEADNTLYFMSSTIQHGRAIQKLEGYTPKYISNQYIDRILNGADITGVTSFVVKSNGHFFYVLNLPNISLVYDESTEDWHLWSGLYPFSPQTITSMSIQSDGSILVSLPFPHTRNDGSPVIIEGSSPSQTTGQFNIRYNSSTMATNQFSYVPSSPVSSITIGSATATLFFEDAFAGVYYSKGPDGDLLLDASSGAVYSFDPLVYEDNENPINVVIQTALLDFGVMATKRYNRFELVGDKTTTNVYVRFTDEDYNNWSLYRRIQLNVKRAKVSNLGSGRRRAFDLLCTDPTALRLLAAEIDYEKGAF